LFPQKRIILDDLVARRPSPTNIAFERSIKIEDYQKKRSIKKGRAIADSAFKIQEITVQCG